MSVSEAAPALDNPLWRYACTLYAAPGVAAACIRLQDEAGCDVNLLLLAAWLGVARRAALTRQDLAAAPGHDWQLDVITPLRAARRAAGNGAKGFYERLKQLELEAEQIRLAALFAWADARFPGQPGAPCRATENLHLVAGTAQGVAALAQAADDAATP